MRRKDTTVYAKERRLVLASVTLLLSMFAAYIYFLSASVVHVIVRKEISQQIAQVNTQVSDLETEYIEAKEQINENMAEERGFSEVSDRIFVTRRPTNLVLSRNDER